MTAGTTEFADLGPLNRAKEQKSWYWYSARLFLVAFAPALYAS